MAFLLIYGSLMDVFEGLFYLRGVHNCYVVVQQRITLFSSMLLFMPSATYFFSAAKKSKQKRPLSNAEGLAQRKSFVEVA